MTPDFYYRRLFATARNFTDAQLERQVGGDDVDGFVDDDADDLEGRDVRAGVAVALVQDQDLLSSASDHLKSKTTDFFSAMTFCRSKITPNKNSPFEELT